MSAFNVNQNDHEYFASTVETITIGRDAVTSLASQEPPHVFDIVWNMDLNTALTNINAPYIIDSNEQEHKDGTNGGKMYTLGTDSFTIEIELTSTSNGSNVTSLTYTQSTETRTGTGADEAKCLVELAKLLSVNSTNTVTLLKDDGTEDVGSSIAPLMVASVSSAIGNSLSSQSTVITDFMTNLKGVVGSYNWYNADSNNLQSVNTQVKYGLAQLFDRDPELNNLIGSSATSSTFLDSEKIKEKMQNNLDPFYIKLFSESQLIEVLEAVADKGSRINGTGDNRKFNFTVGDSITAVVKVADSDSTNGSGNNSDRWLVTLQHAI
jgi:hypothetical protein